VAAEARPTLPVVTEVDIQVSSLALLTSTIQSHLPAAGAAAAVLVVEVIAAVTADLVAGVRVPVTFLVPVAH